LTQSGSLKFVDLGKNFRLPLRGTRDYTQLQERLH